MPTTAASLLVRIGAETSDFQEAMAASVRSTRDVQLAMEQSSRAVTALEARMRSLKEAANLGLLSRQQLGEEARTVSADVAELATQSQLAEGAQSRLARVGAAAARTIQQGMGGTVESSLRAEHAVSRLSFGLAMMGQAGEVGGRGLRGVELGMMSLLPGLGWGLVAVTGLVEAFGIWSRHSEHAAQAMEKAREALQHFIEANRTFTFEPTAADKVRHLGDALAALGAQRDKLTNFWSLGPIFSASAINQLDQQIAAIQDAMKVAQFGEMHQRDQERQREAAEAAKEHARQIRSLVEALERERATFRMSHQEIQYYELRMAGASRATLDHARTLLADVDMLNKATEAAERYKKVLEEWDRAVLAKGAEGDAKLRREEADALRDATEKSREHVEKIKRDDEEMSRNLHAGLEERKRLYEQHAREVERIYQNLFGSLMRGDVRALLTELGNLGISALLASGEGKPGGAARNVPSAASMAGAIYTSLNAGGPSLGQLGQFLQKGPTRFISGGGAMPPYILAGDKDLSAKRGSSFQSALNVQVSSIDSRSTFDLFRRHAPALAELVAQQFRRDARLSLLMDNNSQ
jgi:tetratricopeptide (TPR) repeat protein